MMEVGGMEFSKKLKEICADKGLSQEQLAEKIGVSRQAIARWETGRGMPDIENMKILAEIFKTTIDELIVGSVPESTTGNTYSSESVNDIDMLKHFDIDLGSARSIEVTSGEDEKLHVVLESDSMENIGSLFKVRFDENRNKLDVDCDSKDKVSRFEAEESVRILISLPRVFSEHCEIKASTGLLSIKDLEIDRLEYDGDAEHILIEGSRGSIELTGKKDYDITVDAVHGTLDVNQLKARSVVHIAKEVCPPVVDAGRHCKALFSQDGDIVDYEPDGSTSGEDTIRVSGMFSELVVDLIDER